MYMYLFEYLFLILWGVYQYLGVKLLGHMIILCLTFYLFIYLFIYLFLAALDLRCCAWAFSSCGELGLLFIAVCGLLIAVASLVAEHGL